VYGQAKEFSTLTAASPLVNTDEVSNVTETSGSSGGEVTDQGSSEVTARGVCYGTNENPIIEGDHTTDDNGEGGFVSEITGLVCNTTYYVRAYATNESGTSYGNQVEFTTLECPVDLPSLTTTEITTISSSEVQSGGEVTDQGTSEVTARGVCYGASQDPTIKDDHTSDGDGEGVFVSKVTGLECNTTYYLRAYATNSSGTQYGNPYKFTLECTADIPSVTTAEVTDVTYTTALSGGEVINDGGLAIIVQGVCWSTSQEPTISDFITENGTGSGSFTSEITNLWPNTLYYVRAYATNDAGTGYGSEENFITLDDETTVMDIDGNVYPIVEIGTQIWMAQSLNVTRFPDGKAIPLVEDESTWFNLPKTEEAFCYYDNKPAYGPTYGALYTWPAAMHSAKSSSSSPSGVQGVCPDGWHLPSDAEFKTLEKNLGMSDFEANSEYYRGDSDVGGQLKEKGLDHWDSPNEEASNGSGFTALPAGNREVAEKGEFIDMGRQNHYWTTTASSSEKAWDRTLFYNLQGVGRYRGFNNYGFSVRCIKD